MGWNVLLVDDEELARQRLARQLGDFPEVTIVAEAVDGGSALRAAERFRPDLVFLDIQMPAPNGLEVAARLQDFTPPPRVIFLSAHRQAAAEAFELGASDYLMKPVRAERLKLCLDRLQYFQRPQTQTPRRIALLEEASGQRWLVDPDEISVLIYHGQRQLARCRGREFSLQTSLRKALSCLPEGHFLQVHRSYVVNLEQVERFLPSHHLLILKDGFEVPISRRQLGAFQDGLDWL